LNRVEPLLLLVLSSVLLSSVVVAEHDAAVGAVIREDHSQLVVFSVLCSFACAPKRTCGGRQRALLLVGRVDFVAGLDVGVRARAARAQYCN